jgi:protein tyrosine phosphatase (PTP) superfamily phosphohydrolase (DUF442 family)
MHAVLVGVVLVAMAVGVFTAAGGDPAGTPPPPPAAGPSLPADTATKPVDLPGLHNVVAFAPGLFSGSEPDGVAGLATLKAAGVRTVISVDGARPLADEARALGMRYVHLPVGYQGIDRARQLELTRAVRDLPGPVYVHCHHGKHRSAAALGSILVLLDQLTPEEAVARMKVSGTSPSYPGLYACVERLEPAAPAAIDAADATFPAHSKVSGMVESMVAIQLAFDHLGAIEKAGWTTPADSPDLVPAAEAGRLADLLRNLIADPSVVKDGPTMVERMRSSAALATDLEERLVAAKAGAARAGGTIDGAALSGAFKLVAASCKDCHAVLRDKAQEKGQ